MKVILQEYTSGLGWFWPISATIYAGLKQATTPLREVNPPPP
jgi:hypothetical protein